MSSRMPQETTVGELKVTTVPLPYKVAEDHLPEVAMILARVMEKLVELGMETDIKTDADVVKLAPVLGTLAEQLGDGRLRRMVQPILSTTIVTAKIDGELEECHLLKESDRARLFDEYPEAYFPILFFAGKVTYARFFPAAALLGSSKRGKKMAAVSS